MPCVLLRASQWALFGKLGPAWRQTRGFAARHSPPIDALSKAGWKTIIGLEIHTQLKTREKLFSGARTSWEEPVNTNVALLDAAFPGTLPTLNREAVAVAVKTALALDCSINPRSTFDRKHYFYHDIPASYQITQHYNPLATAGRLVVAPRAPKDSPLSVGIQQIQLEQDTAKTSRVRGADGDGDEVVVDLNRAGSGLIEIVTEPDMRSPEEAATFIRALQAVLRRLGASDGDMEKGSLRVDANVSVHRDGKGWGTRCEIKNLNSVRFMQAALDFERHRHVKFLEEHSGQQVRQETRGFDEVRGETYTLRTKEDAQDYRYMPDPNIPPIAILPSYLQALRKALPELPDAARARLTAQYGISVTDVDTLLSMDDIDGAGVAYFERVVEASGAEAAKKAVNWIAHELLGQLATRETIWSPDVLPASDLAKLIKLIDDKVLTGTSAKTLLRALLDRNAGEFVSVDSLVEQLGLRSPAIDLDTVCSAVIAALPKEADSVRKGNERVVMRLVGQVMKDTGGAADAKEARAILLNMLKGDA